MKWIFLPPRKIRDNLSLFADGIIIPAPYMGPNVLGF